MTTATHGITRASISYQRRLLTAGHLLAFASGATALVYEVLWMRQFVSLFGATAPAISATLAAIFFGFAAGNNLIGKRSARWRRPLRAYAILEFGIGLAALLVVPLLGLYEHVYPVIYEKFAGYSVVFWIVKMCLAVAALFVPTFLMGGTLPLLAEAFVSASRGLGRVGSGVYAANTFGATLGALSVPFYLLSTLGAHRSYLAAALVNLLVGALAIWLDRGFQESGRQTETTRLSDTHGAPGKSVRVMGAWMFTSFAFLSGALVLALEVLWTRMLAQVHENSVYSFAVVLAVFLVGLATGAAVARVLLVRRWDLRKLLGFAWIVAGVLVFGSPLLFYFLTDGLRYVNEFGAHENLATLGFALATMLVPTMFAGMILPLLMEMTAMTRAGAAGALLGRLLAINTAGAIVGPLVATYVILPALGLWMGIAFVGLAMIVAGEAALQNLFKIKVEIRRRAVIVGLLLALVMSGSPASLPRVRVMRDGSERLVHLKEGSHGIVAVLENADDRWMLLNNFYTLGGTASAVEERQQARIPLLLHPAPRKVAFLGMGTGITAGGALHLPVEKVVALELVPEVVTTARDHFADANLGLLDNSKVEVVKEDARIYLKTVGQDFDVIIGDLVVPWRSGESALFTREHFETTRRSLAPGGIFCQWLPMYQLSEEQFRIIVATFLDVFPHTTLWRGDFLPDAPALALIGHTAPDGIDARAVDERVRQLKPALAQSTPMLSADGGLWMFLVGPISAADSQFVNARRNRESEPWIELLSPRTQQSSERASSSTFVRANLYRFMEKIRAQSLDASPLKTLDAEHVKWREAGAILWEASMFLEAGREEAANKRAAEALALVPDELRAVITGDAVQK